MWKILEKIRGYHREKIVGNPGVLATVRAGRVATCQGKIKFSPGQGISVISSMLGNFCHDN